MIRFDCAKRLKKKSRVPFSHHLARKFVIFAFLLRGAFYCVGQPIWEGFDEWAHFAYIQHLSQYGHLPTRTDQISAELRRSLELAPISASAADNSRESLSHDEFWRLPPDDRLTRERELEELRASFAGTNLGSRMLRQYEAQQPPLYYLLMVPIYLSLKNASLPAQVFALRFASLLICGVGILLCCELAWQVPASRRAAIPIMLLLSSWPGFLIGVSRISNDVLALTLGTAYILCLFKIVRGNSKLSDWMLAGMVLGIALLAKSYMLALVPLLPVVMVIEAVRCRSRLQSVWRGLLVAFATATLICGWWYIGNYQATGTLSGEQIDAAAAHFGFLGKLRAVGSIQWLRVLDSAATTHIWTGGWSFLTVRSWMYRVFECQALLAGVGLSSLAARLLRKLYRRGLGYRDAFLFLAVCAYLFFCSALAYYAIAVYLTRGVSTTIGWYLDALAGVEGVLLASGFTGLVGTRRAAGCVAAAAALACVFDLYTVNFVSVPYYTGLTAHLHSGFVSSFHPVATLRHIGLVGVLTRLAVNKPVAPSVLGTLWIGYLFATFGLVACSAVAIKQAFFLRRQLQSTSLVA